MSAWKNVDVEADCAVCEGRGRVMVDGPFLLETEPCEPCDGSGRVSVPPAEWAEALATVEGVEILPPPSFPARVVLVETIAEDIEVGAQVYDEDSGFRTVVAKATDECSGESELTFDGDDSTAYTGTYWLRFTPASASTREDGQR